jgi:hypothetical protein
MVQVEPPSVVAMIPGKPAAKQVDVDGHDTPSRK